MNIIKSIPFISKNKSGFRFSLIDLSVIILAIVTTVIYSPDLTQPAKVDNLFSYLIPYIVLNFFLFCNVFRVRTKYELCWLVSATINILLFLLYYQNIVNFFLSQSVLTSIAIYGEIRQDNYHGIFCKIQEKNEINKNATV